MAARKVSYLLFACVVGLIIFLHLGPVVLAGFFSYMILDATHRNLAKRMNEFLARWLSVLFFLLTAVIVAWLFWIFIRLSLLRLPDILSYAVPKITDLAANYSINLPFENPQQLRVLALESIRENARSITLESFVLTKDFFQIILIAFVAILRFMEGRRRLSDTTWFGAVYEEFAQRVGSFMQEFEKVIGAQVVIAAVNTLLTGALLIALRLPYIRFLTLSTFMFGMLPVIGNIISNSLIAGTALMLSPQHAVVVLVALVVLHKAEYLLNSRIVSSRVDLPTWQTLLGILVGEMLMGIPGIILAPAVITHIRKEMHAIPYPAKGADAAH